MDPLLEVFRSAVAGDTKAIWLLAAAYALIVCTYSFLYQLRMRNWRQTYGTLDKRDIAPFGTSSRPLSGRHYKARTEYRYEVDGCEYTGSRVSAWDMVASHNLRGLLRMQLRGVRFDENGKVRVFFNPTRPNKSILILPGVGGMLLTALVGLVPCLLYYLAY